MNAALLLLALLIQDDAARARALLGETSAKLKAAPAIAFEKTSSQQQENSKEPYGHNVSKVILRRPNQMVTDATGKDWDLITVLDGTNLWQLDRKKNEYRKYPQKAGGSDYWMRDDRLNALYLGETPEKTLEGARDVRVRQEKECEVTYDVITWKAKPPREQMESADFTLWLGPDRLPRRYIKQYESRDVILTHTSEYAKIDLAPKISDDTFSFTPPPGAKLADPNEHRRRRIPTTEEAKKAQKILEKVQEAFRKAETVRYETTIKDPVNGTSRTFITLKRANLLRRASGISEAEATGLMLCDGTDLWHVDVAERTYRKYAMLAGPTQHLGNTDPLASLILEPGAPLVLCETRDVTVEKATLQGAECDIIGWKTAPGSGYSQKFKLWINPDRRPLQLVTEWSSQGRSGSSTTKYESFDLSPTIPEGHFAFKPGAGWRDLTNEQPGAKHLAVGTAAPDFEATDRGGAPIRLSELRGKPVVLVFGKYSHSSESDRAQEFHDDFGPRGVIVLAVSSGKKEAAYDPKKHTFRLLRPKDASTTAAFGAELWGSLYLIGADGKVLIATMANEQLKAAVNGVTQLPAAPAGGEKEARETLKRAAEPLKRAGSIGYQATWYLKDSAGFTRFECRIMLKRPNLVRLEGAYRTDSGRDDPGVFVYDGKNEWGFYPKEKEKKYTCRPQDPDASGGPYDDPVRLFFFGEPLTRWMDLAEDLKQTSDRLDGTPCSVVEWRVRYTSDVKYKLWIDGTSTVRRLERTVGGEPFLSVTYGKIDPEPKIEEGAFRFEPPADATPYNWSVDYEKKLIAVGAEAPEFEAKDLEGKKVKLSGWRGKPVLFFTWYFP